MNILNSTNQQVKNSTEIDWSFQHQIEMSEIFRMQGDLVHRFEKIGNAFGFPNVWKKKREKKSTRLKYLFINYFVKIINDFLFPNLNICQTFDSSSTTYSTFEF